MLQDVKKKKKKRVQKILVPFCFRLATILERYTMQDLNQQQLEYIDDRMRVAQFVNLDRPENNKSMRIAMDLNQLATPNSSYITSQAVGR